MLEKMRTFCRCQSAHILVIMFTDVQVKRLVTYSINLGYLHYEIELRFLI